MQAELLTFTQIQTLRDGDPIPAVRLKLTKVGDYKSGTNAKGTWSLQPCTVSDGAANFKLKLWNRPELGRDWQNVPVIFQSIPGDKKPWLGLKKGTDEYKGKVTTMIEADERATMVQDTGQVSAAVVSAPPPIVPVTSAPVAAHPVQAPVGEKKPWQPLGVTVGMAVNNACASLNAQGRAIDAETLFGLASEILRVARALEEGRLAPKASELLKAATEQQPTTT